MTSGHHGDMGAPSSVGFPVGPSSTLDLVNVTSSSLAKNFKYMSRQIENLDASQGGWTAPAHPEALKGGRSCDRPQAPRPSWKKCLPCPWLSLTFFPRAAGQRWFRSCAGGSEVPRPAVSLGLGPSPGHVPCCEQQVCSAPEGAARLPPVCHPSATSRSAPPLSRAPPRAACPPC